MQQHTTLTERRIEKDLEKLIAPAIFRPLADLNVEVHQSEEPISYDQAQAASYRTIGIPFDWGPFWSTAWFRLTGPSVKAGPGEEVVLRFNSGSEALLWIEGKPFKGFNDQWHTFAPLPRKVLKGEAVTLAMEGVCNRLMGARGIQEGNKPARLSMARLSARHLETWHLFQDAELLFLLMRELPEGSPRRKRLLYGLNDMLNRLDPDDVPASAAEARKPLAELLACHADASATVASSIGHSHIDVAWLWPYRETIRKCSRTFSTVLRLMEQYPEYTFIQSQAQLYDYVKTHYPSIYKQIVRRVKEGRWEADGGTWVEMDCNLASGEAIFRQILHAHRFFGKEFGTRCHYLWLPDVFGYSAALPQMLTQCGLESFLTQKLSWNQFNRFPYYTFWWQGIDGSRIFSHFYATHTYNGRNTPAQLIKGQRNYAESDRSERWLNPFGIGDGGGGPCPEMLERARRARDLEGLPRVEFDTVANTLDKLKAESHDLPTWCGELYLEFHRGTYTTQARTKRGNRKSELLLRDVECLMALAPKAPPKADLAELDRLWKLVLLNQFHDVLPGSSIGWVYKDAENHYAEVARAGEALREKYMRQWGAAMDSHAAKHPAVVANTCNWQRTDLVTLPREGSDTARAALASGKSMPVQAVEDERGNPAWLTQVTVPSMGAAVVDRVADEANPPKAFQPVTVTGRTLENRFLKVTTDERGQVERIFDKEANREVLHDGRPANRLCLYVDRPITYDAWDVDAYYLEREPRGSEVESIEVTEQGPIRATIEVRLTLGKASTAIQRIRLAADSRRIDFDTEVDWHERDTLLRALFPVRVLSDQATYEIQFGHVRRPNHFNTSWDMARFEVCAQKWIDLSEADYGVALMNDCKYGHSCHGDTMGISLLRSPTTPDPEADQGAHRFAYSLYPHPGDLRKAEVVRRAYELNVPLVAADIEPAKGPRGRRWCGLGVEGRGVVVESIKPAEPPADGRVIVRAYESHGGRGSARLTCGVPFKDAVAVTPLEEPTERYAVMQEGNDVRLDFSPFAIRSVALLRE